jgi:hypothetical protein
MKSKPRAVPAAVEDESADPVGDGHSDADYAAQMPPPQHPNPAPDQSEPPGEGPDGERPDGEGEGQGDGEGDAHPAKHPHRLLTHRR